MLNPLKWPSERYAVLSAGIIVGATVGTVFGFMQSRYSHSFSDWFLRYPADALTWAIAGAVIAGGTIYAWLVSK